MEIIWEKEDYKWTDVLVGTWLRQRSRLWQKCLFVGIFSYTSISGIWFYYTGKGDFLLKVLFAGLGIIGLVHFVLIPIAAYLQFKASKKMGERDVRYVFDEDGFSVTSDMSHFRLTWQQCKMWRENKRMIVVCLHVGQGLLFPRRLFQSDEEWDSFRSILSKHLKKR
jgi:hypothetical protein